MLHQVKNGEENQIGKKGPPGHENVTRREGEGTMK